MADYIFPFLNEAMDFSLVKIYVFRSKEIIKGALYLFLGFQVFISEEPLKGPEEVEILWGKVRGIGGWGKTLKPRDSRVSLVTFAVWGAALS